MSHFVLQFPHKTWLYNVTKKHELWKKPEHADKNICFFGISNKNYSESSFISCQNKNLRYKCKVEKWFSKFVRSLYLLTANISITEYKRSCQWKYQEQIYLQLEQITTSHQHCLNQHVNKITDSLKRAGLYTTQLLWKKKKKKGQHDINSLYD